MEIEKIKNYLVGAALGAFALFGVGFGMSGWVQSQITDIALPDVGLRGNSGLTYSPV